VVAVTVVLDADVEQYVREMQAWMIRIGWSCSRSQIINMLLVGDFHRMVRRNPDSATFERVSTYLLTRNANITKEEWRLLDEFMEKATPMWDKLRSEQEEKKKRST